MEPAVTPLELVESLLGADQDGEFHRRGMIFHAMWPGPYRPPKAKKKTSKKPRRTAEVGVWKKKACVAWDSRHV